VIVGVSNQPGFARHQNRRSAQEKRQQQGIFLEHGGWHHSIADYRWSASRELTLAHNGGVNPILLNWGPAVVIVGGYLLGFYLNRRLDDLRTETGKRSDDLRVHLDKRIDDLRAHLDKRIDDLRADVDKRIGDLDKRIDDVQDGLRAEIRASEASLQAGRPHWSPLSRRTTVS
jgi:hypothetical protein